MSGAEYQRLPAGPAPRRLRPVRDLLIARGDARLEMEPYRGRTQHRLIPLRAPRWDLFDATETVAIEEMLEMYRSETGTALSNLSHEEPAWDLFEDGETIRFEMAFAATEPPGGAARAHAKELAEKYLGR
ncbi:MAG: type II toxin-antitoxin system antitoxin SocA domain-containing protein [Acidimicrobiia bacterium]